MRTRMLLSTVLVLAILALVAPSTLAAGKGGGGGGGDGVTGIILTIRGGSQQVMMSAQDGTVLSEVDCGGDLTHGDAPRYFLHAEHTGGVLRVGEGAATRSYGNYDLYAFDEVHSTSDCTSGTLLFGDPNTYNRPPYLT